MNDSNNDFSAARRRLLGQAALGAAAATGAFVAKPALSNTMNPPKPMTGSVRADGRFAGKVVLITGATAGIGETTAKAFAREGAKVAFNGRRAQLGQKVEKEIRAFGGEATYTHILHQYK